MELLGYANQLRIVAAFLVPATFASLSQAQNTFVNQALARGVNYTVGSNNSFIGQGVALADLNGNGHLDIIALGANSGVVGIFQNNGSGQFTNRSAQSGIPPTTWVTSVTAIDFDGDGDLDLHLVRAGHPDRLYRNDGNFSFTDVSVASGLNSGGYGIGANWADYDGDGWLDVYLCNRTGTEGNFIENQLFRNNGNGTFTDVTVQLGVQATGDPTLLALWFDFDNDGDPDLYLGTDKGFDSPFTNRLYRNNGDGTFTEITQQANMEANLDCMGFAVGDISGNGFQDVYMTNLPPGNLLMLNNGDGTFSDATAAAELEVFALGWATGFFDYDNDTDLDLFVCNEMAPNRLFRNNGSFPFTDVTPTSGLGELATSYTFAYGDIDGDGDLDMIVSNINQPLRVFINTVGQDNHWIKLNVVGYGPNTKAIGAVVRLTANNISQMREVFSGGNYLSQNQTVLHFGLGPFTLATQTIEVRWPNSNVRRTLTGYPANQTWNIYPPSRLGDVNNDGVISTSEIEQAIHVMQALGGGELQPGHEIFDINGDCRVTLIDILAMTKRLQSASGSNSPAVRTP